MRKAPDRLIAHLSQTPLPPACRPACAVVNRRPPSPAAAGTSTPRAGRDSAASPLHAGAFSDTRREPPRRRQGRHGHEVGRPAQQPIAPPAQQRLARLPGRRAPAAHAVQTARLHVAARWEPADANPAAPSPPRPPARSADPVQEAEASLRAYRDKYCNAGLLRRGRKAAFKELQTSSYEADVVQPLARLRAISEEHQVRARRGQPAAAAAAAG
jgi:hypothetical protein